MSTVLLEKRGFIAHMRLNRPEKLNAVHPDMVCELAAALDEAEQDAVVRVVILSGNGRAFSAGFDLNGGSRRDGETAKQQLCRELTEAFDIIMRFRNCPKPLIAAVHGYCLGSSMELAAVCDLTISADDCRFGAPEVRFGSGIVCMILPWIIGQKNARELLLLGNKIDAQTALSIGLVTRVVAVESLYDEAKSLARDIALNDPLAVQLTKRAMNRSQDIAGLGQALREALETDLEIETTDTTESVKFNSVRENDGLKAALAWRESLLDADACEEGTA